MTEIRLESIWKCQSFRSESVLNQIRISFDSDLKCKSSFRRVQSITGKWLPGFQETLPWHLILAPRSHILEKGDQIHPLFRVFQNMRLIFSWNSRPSKAQKDLIHLARKPKMAKPTLTLFQEYDT